ncbi:uncharacterized protein [Spinacia oleracea]|nr:uncharacterized protein LOC110796529 isoform X3 [Spinacia oleracea]
MGGYGGYVDGGDFRSKVWSISGGPKYRRRNSAFSDVFLICVPVAMKFAHLENVEGRWGRRSDQSNLPVTWPIISIHCWCLCCSNDGRDSQFSSYDKEKIDKELNGCSTNVLAKLF